MHLEKKISDKKIMMKIINAPSNQDGIERNIPSLKKHL
jgi:hypothetical protein